MPPPPGSRADTPELSRGPVTPPPPRPPPGTTLRLPGPPRSQALRPVLRPDLFVSPFALGDQLGDFLASQRLLVHQHRRDKGNRGPMFLDEPAGFLVTAPDQIVDPIPIPIELLRGDHPPADVSGGRR